VLVNVVLRGHFIRLGRIMRHGLPALDVDEGRRHGHGAGSIHLDLRNGHGVLAGCSDFDVAAVRQLHHASRIVMQGDLALLLIAQSVLLIAGCHDDAIGPVAGCEDPHGV
jgi:hypothetical protein